MRGFENKRDYQSRMRGFLRPRSPGQTEIIIFFEKNDALSSTCHNLLAWWKGNNGTFMTDTLSTAEKTTRTSAAAPVTQADPENAAPRPPIQFLGIPLPTPISQGIRFIGDQFQKARQKTIAAAPPVIVNHSSNLIGGLQIAGEVMMFQASAKEPLVKNHRSLMSWIVDPPKTILSEIFKKTQGGTGFKDIFNGNPFKNFYTQLTDVEAATLRERSMQRAAAAKIGRTLADNHIGLPNRWQARSTLAGLTGWGINTLMPDNKDTPEEVERMATLAENRPLSYIAERFRQAVWIPEWPQHKRQMTGLGVMISGICSSIGAWRNRAELPPKGSKLYKYKFNGSYLLTGLSTLAASMPLLFRIDNDRGYANYGEIHLLRVFFLPKSIWNKYDYKEPGRHWYLGGASTFQTQNLAAALIGGAEKRPDGTVVDTKAIREEAKRKAALAKAEAALHRDVQEEKPQGQPQTRIQTDSVAQVEHTPPQQNAALAKA
jgi:hypothetical protein